MTRQSASSIKGKGAGRKLNTEPTPGTNLRQAYDRLLHTEGWVDLSDIKGGNTLRNLREKYDLEVVIRRQSKLYGKCVFRCIGRWVNDELLSREDVVMLVRN